MTPARARADVASLVAAARRDLEDVEAALRHGGDCLVALVVLARAEKRADEAMFALLDARAEEVAGKSVVHTHRGYDRFQSDGRRSG